MEEIYVTDSFQETEELGESFAKSIKSHAIVCLYGNLGGGKTTFMRGVAKGFGISERVTSPTFVVVRQHIMKQKNIKKLYHCDLYRLSEKDIEKIGLEEILEDENAIVFIEWAEKAENLLPKYKKYQIHFKDLGDDKREVIIKK